MQNRLHLLFLGQTLVQHSYHFSVPDLIFSLPPNSIFQQIIPVARKRPPSAGNGVRSFVAHAAQRGATDTQPPSLRGSCHAGPGGDQPGAARGRQLQDPSGPRGCELRRAAPRLREPWGPAGLRKMAEAAPPRPGFVPALRLRAPPPGNSDTQRRLSSSAARSRASHPAPRAARDVTAPPPAPAASHRAPRAARDVTIRPRPPEQPARRSHP